MAHPPFCIRALLSGGAIIAALAASAQADEWDKRDGRDHRRPVYQRRAFEHHDKDGFKHRRDRFHAPHSFAPQVSSGWFQRPYPYHLDYYRMRYGGSYAPYFGNLYGPPQVVTAPPYYGPYYGGYEHGLPGAYGPTGAYPGFSNGVVNEAPIEENAPGNQSINPSDDDSLPVPAH